MLQTEGITLVEVQDLFDEVLEDYPELCGHLSVDSKIVVNPVFEKAVLKLSKNLTLSDAERQCVSCLLLPDENGAANNDSAHFALPQTSTTTNGGGTVRQPELTYAQKLKLGMKRKRMGNGNDNTRNYMNLDVLVGTSVSRERLSLLPSLS